MEVHEVNRVKESDCGPRGLRKGRKISYLKCSCWMLKRTGGLRFS